MKARVPLFAASCVLCGQLFAEPPSKPNIILILADDLGAKELSCYGNKEHKTPNLDRMASEGMRFETFYATPLCTPTPSKNNRVEFNHIHHIMQKADDGGAVYTLGNMPGSVIRGNHVHHTRKEKRIRGWGGDIYLDEGSGFQAQSEDLAELPAEAKEVAARAGLLPEFRDLLKGHCRP